MDIMGTASAAQAATPGQGVPADVQTAMLRKALDQAASSAAQLIAAVPAPPPLASSGPVGTRVNTLA
jgi:hypothetical protein